MNNKYKIIALFGEAGAGKDYLQKEIMKIPFGKNNLFPIISCTTRKPRDYEIDGINYHFLPNADAFLSGEKLKKYIEFTCFKNDWYGTSIDHLSTDKINIGIFNIDGIKQILKINNIKCFPVRVLCSDKTRLIRQLNREASPDCDEIIRRFQTDRKDFANIDFDYVSIDNENNSDPQAIEELYYILKEIERSK